MMPQSQTTDFNNPVNNTTLGPQYSFSQFPSGSIPVLAPMPLSQTNPAYVAAAASQLQGMYIYPTATGYLHTAPNLMLGSTHGMLQGAVDVSGVSHPAAAPIPNHKITGFDPTQHFGTIPQLPNRKIKNSVMSKTNLYINGLSEFDTDDSVRALVKDIIEPKSCKAMMSHGKCRGSGFIDCATEEDAEKVIHELRNKTMRDGSKLTVKFAYENEKDDLNVYVRNLPRKSSFTNSNLEDLFREFGQVVSVKLLQSDNQYTGTGFVRFNHPDEAQKAVEIMNSRKCILGDDDKPVICKLADKGGRRNGTGSNSSNNNTNSSNNSITTNGVLTDHPHHHPHHHHPHHPHHNGINSNLQNGVATSIYDAAALMNGGGGLQPAPSHQPPPHHHMAPHHSNGGNDTHHHHSHHPAQQISATGVPPGVPHSHHHLYQQHHNPVTACYTNQQQTAVSSTHPGPSATAIAWQPTGVPSNTGPILQSALTDPNMLAQEFQSLMLAAAASQGQSDELAHHIAAHLFGVTSSPSNNTNSSSISTTSSNSQPQMTRLMAAIAASYNNSAANVGTQPTHLSRPSAATYGGTTANTNAPRSIIIPQQQPPPQPLMHHVYTATPQLPQVNTTPTPNIAPVTSATTNTTSNTTSTLPSPPISTTPAANTTNNE